MLDLPALLRAEELDDIEGLLRPRAWDEVPLVSRLHRIAALRSLGVHEVSRPEAGSSERSRAGAPAPARHLARPEGGERQPDTSRQLLIGAVGHLARVLDVAESRPRGDLLVVISLPFWDDFSAPEADPVIPNFWISTDTVRDLVELPFVPGATPEALLVSHWLTTSDLLHEHLVLDNVLAETEPGLKRVYVARRGRLGIDRFVAPRDAAR